MERGQQSSGHIRLVPKGHQRVDGAAPIVLSVEGCVAYKGATSNRHLDVRPRARLRVKNRSVAETQKEECNYRMHRHNEADPGLRLSGHPTALPASETYHVLRLNPSPVAKSR